MKTIFILFCILCVGFNDPSVQYTHIVLVDSTRTVDLFDGSIYQQKKADTLRSFVATSHFRQQRDTIGLLLPIDDRIIITNTIIYENKQKDFVHLSYPKLSGDSVKVILPISRKTYKHYKNYHFRAKKSCSMGIEKTGRKRFFFVQYPCYIGQKAKKLFLEKTKNEEIVIGDIISFVNAKPSYRWVYYH